MSSSAQKRRRSALEDNVARIPEVKAKRLHRSASEISRTSSTFHLEPLLPEDPMHRTISRQADIASFKPVLVEDLTTTVSTEVVLPNENDDKRAQAPFGTDKDFGKGVTLMAKSPTRSPSQDTKRAKRLLSNSKSPLPAGFTDNGLPVRTRSEQLSSRRDPIRRPPPFHTLPEFISSQHQHIFEATRSVMIEMGHLAPETDIVLHAAHWLRNDTRKLALALINQTRPGVYTVEGKDGEENVQDLKRWITNDVANDPVSSQDQSDYLSAIQWVMPRFAIYFAELQALQKYHSAEAKASNPPRIQPYKVEVPAISATLGPVAYYQTKLKLEKILSGDNLQMLQDAQKISYLCPDPSVFANWIFDGQPYEVEKDDITLVRILGLHARERMKLLASIGLRFAATREGEEHVKKHTSPSDLTQTTDEKLTNVDKSANANEAEENIHPSEFDLAELRNALSIVDGLGTMFR
ncbi:hypothetical protein AAMO2058_001287200 [Amorphochlora amoebiformis]